MPNAAATFDDAFDYDEPVRRKAPRRPRSAAGKGPQRKKGRRLAFDMRKVARWTAVGLGTTVALTIMVNALVLQKSRHPAPLFGKAIALGPGPAPVERAPAPRADPVDAPAATPAPAPVVQQRAPVEVTEDEAPTRDDPIGRLLQGGPPPAGAAAKPDTKTVMGAQRALAKLGFALKPNGTLGPQTRKAIEAFEKDRHLPVKGELTRRLVKILAAESGVRID